MTPAEPSSGQVPPMAPLVDRFTINTGEADGETASLTGMHRVDLPPYTRYVVLAADRYEEMRAVVTAAAELSLNTRGNPLRPGALRDVVRDARALVDP